MMDEMSSFFSFSGGTVLHVNLHGTLLSYTRWMRSLTRRGVLWRGKQAKRHSPLVDKKRRRKKDQQYASSAAILVAQKMSGITGAYGLGLQHP
jgi:hypothetical protein